MGYVKWIEYRYGEWSKPFWRKEKNLNSAKEKVKKWNYNSFDKIKILKYSNKKPIGYKENSKGTYFEKQDKKLKGVLK